MTGSFDTGVRVSWADLGKPTQGGDYRFRDMTIGVLPHNIETWQEQPSARFRVIATDEMDGRFYALGSWDV